MHHEPAEQRRLIETSLRAGESTQAIFAFDVRNGVNRLDELAIKTRGDDAIIHVSLS
jgi:hypothetical protein